MSANLPPPPELDTGAALFLDLDGTLLDFADRPEAVHMHPATVDALQRLRFALGGALAVVSGRTLAEIERMAILQTLQRTNWNKQEAAQVLGLYRPTLYSKMKKHGIHDAGKGARPSPRGTSNVSAA